MPKPRIPGLWRTEACLDGATRRQRQRVVATNPFPAIAQQSLKTTAVVNCSTLPWGYLELQIFPFKLLRVL